MKCPTCATVDLVMTERQGVEIDYCSKCRGVWLDRGELDKIIEKSTRPANYPPPDDREYGQRHGGHSERHSSHGSSGHGSSGYRRKSWLSDIFD